jgi:hypothetical protein
MAAKLRPYPQGGVSTAAAVNITNTTVSMVDDVVAVVIPAVYAEGEMWPGFHFQAWSNGCC